MDNNALLKLEKNLTRSAKKAQQYWVRGMIGFTESDQGFFPIEAVPLFNPIRNKNTTLAELIEDTGNLSVDHNKLRLSYVELQTELIEYKRAQVELQLENKKVTDELAQRISAIEAFRID